MTSPPFALQRKKEYGNKDESEYIDWLAEFARLVHRKLTDDGSFVLDLGGACTRKGVSAHCANWCFTMKEIRYMLLHERLEEGTSRTRSADRGIAGGGANSNPPRLNASSAVWRSWKAC